MKKSKLFLSLALASAMLLSACAGSSSNTGSSGEGSEAAASGSGKVYYLNFKPEQDGQWQELAKLYTQETGVQVKVFTAAANQYEPTLKSEMAKTEAPTLFQVNGPIGLKRWSEYCYDLTGSDIVNELSSKDFALMEGDKTAGVGYVIESYGIIYNKELLEKSGHKAEDIKSFAQLKEVAEDITARKSELGFSAFTSAGMDGSSDWRFKTHLANLPIYYEYKADHIDSTDAIKGTYLDYYRDIWDLYINNSTTDPALLSTKTGDDAVAEFVTNKAVFYQNGTWAYSDVRDLGDDNLGMLPIYIGVDGEEKQGLCTGTENYWCVNAKASDADIKATLDFMKWCATSEVAVKAMCGTEGAMPSGGDGMGFVTPFKSNLESANPLVNIANKYVKDGKTAVTWTFTTMPSEQWKDGVGSALTAYAANQSDDTWAEVKKAFVEGWATEAAANKDKE